MTPNSMLRPVPRNTNCGDVRNPDGASVAAAFRPASFSEPHHSDHPRQGHDSPDYPRRILGHNFLEASAALESSNLL
jgi:hypothetical protein